MPDPHGLLTTGRPGLTIPEAARLFILPIAETDALRWAAGGIDDLAILLRAQIVPQAVFVGELPNHAAYRAMVRACAHWRRKGAFGAVYRTRNEVIVKHFAEPGARAIWQDPDGRRRYILPSDGFNRWLRKF